MDEVVNKLTKLKALLDAGAISREEFERQKARLLAGGTKPQSAGSGKTSRRSIRIAAWLWVVIAVAVVVLAGGIILFLRLHGSSAPASASVMMDDFTQDHSLSSGLWLVNGPVAAAVSAGVGSQPNSLASPDVRFSAGSGLEMAGPAGPGETSAIQSVSTFDLPLDLKADVMPSASGDIFGLIISDAAGKTGVGFLGRISSPDGPGMIEFVMPGPESRWDSHATLDSSTQPNTWYALSVVSDAQGGASLTIQNDGEIIGHMSVHLGRGRFYVTLLQSGSGQPSSPQGHTHWRSIEVLSGAGLARQTANFSTATTSRVQDGGTVLPTFREPIVTGGQTSLSLAPGQSIYLYGMATGGGAPSTAFVAGDYARASDAAGQLAVALAATSENTDSFTTNTGYYVIGGMGVSGFSRYSASYGSNGSTGAPSASDMFTLSQNSLVVVIALAAGQQSIRLNGIPGLHMDASSSEPEAMVIGHAHLVPGEYTITEHSAALAGGQDPNHMADLVGVFVFQ